MYEGQGTRHGDRKKITRVMKYMRTTIELPLILGIDDSGVLRWHVDAAFVMHNDMRSNIDFGTRSGEFRIHPANAHHEELNRG